MFRSEQCARATARPSSGTSEVGAILIPCSRELPKFRPNERVDSCLRSSSATAAILAHIGRVHTGRGSHVDVSVCLSGLLLHYDDPRWRIICKAEDITVP